MGIATSMKELTRDILSSSEDRAEKLTQLREETKGLRREASDQVKDYSATRRDTKRQLQKQLTQSSVDRRKQVNQELKDSQNLIKTFRNDRKNGGTQLRKTLALGMARLSSEEKARQQQVQDMLKQVRNSRHDASAQLRADLAQSRVDMKAAVSDTLKGAESLVSGYRSSRQALGSTQRKELNKDKGNRQTEVKGMLGDFRGTRGQVRTELSQASQSWKGMRSGGQSVKEVKSAKATPAGANLEEKLLKIVRQHAVGVTLSEAGHTLGLAAIRMGKAAKTLREQGKIRKEGKIYFPITNG